MVETGADAVQFTGEAFPGGVARLVGDGVEDDEADSARPPGQVIDAGLGGARGCVWGVGHGYEATVAWMTHWVRMVRDRVLLMA